MPRQPRRITCEPHERDAIEKLSTSRTAEARLVERARIVLGCLNGEPVIQIARRLRVRPIPLSNGGTV